MSAQVYGSFTCSRCGNGGSMPPPSSCQWCGLPFAREVPAFTGTRESLHARVSDVIRRSGVSDAEQLIRAMEQFEAARVAGLDSIRDVLAWSGEWKVGCDCWDRFAEISKRMDAARLSGRSIGPSKPASERAE